jgi:hypothetical protein
MLNKYIYFVLLLFAFVACRPSQVTIPQKILMEIKTRDINYRHYYDFDVNNIYNWKENVIKNFLQKTNVNLSDLKDSCANAINLISNWADTMRDDGKKAIFPYVDSLNFLLEANNLNQNDIDPEFDRVVLQNISINLEFILKLINKFASAQNNLYYRSRPAKEVLLFKRTPNIDTIAVGDTLQLLYSVVPKWQDSLYVLQISNTENIFGNLYGENNTFRYTFVAKKKGENRFSFTCYINEKYKKLTYADLYFENYFQIFVK